MKKLKLAAGHEGYNKGNTVWLVDEVTRGNGPVVLLTKTKGGAKPSFELGRWRSTPEGFVPSGERLALTERELEKVGNFFCRRQGKTPTADEVKKIKRRVFFGFAG